MHKLFSSIYRAVFIIILLFLFNLTSPHSIFALDIELSGVEKQYLIDHPVLRIANEMDWPPYDFVENAKPAGYSIELITLIAKQLGIELEFVNGYSWTELMSLFEKGKIDIMPAIYFSEDREKFMSFTDPYSEQPTVMVTGNLSNINTLTDIKNNRVALISEFVITNTLLDKFPELHVVEVKSVLEGLTAVSAGTADVFFESIGAVSYILEHNYIPNLAVKSNPSLDQFKAPALHMAVQKENLILLGLLEKTFNGIPANELKIIKDHWMPSSNIIRSEKQSGALLNILYLFGVIFLGIAGIGIVLMLSMKRLNIGPKIWIAFSSISIFAVAIIGTNAYMSVKNTLEEESYSKLTTIREIKSIQIENYTNILRDQVCTFSENLMIIEAMKTFKKTFQVIDEELGIDSRNSQDISENLNLYYSNEFIPRLNLNLDSDVSKKMYIPKQLKTQIIQNLYITENPNSIGQKQLLNDAGDGSHYSKAHSLYHPVIRSFLEKFGYYDIFLVDSETGHIVYSVFKEVDYGTSLLSGPYQSTNIAKAFNLSNESTTPDYVKLIDFENYPPSYNAHASFISSPIFDGDRKIGVLIFQMPNDRINDIMTSNQDWYRVGLGASGETYILGSDLKMRNQSRFLTEDRKNYLKAISKIGTPDSIIDCIDRLNTSVGLQEVKTLGAGKALLGETGTQIFPDYRNIDVLSSYKPLNIKDVNWVIMSEIDASEAFSHVIEFRNKLIAWMVALFFAISIFALYFSRTLTNPIKTLAGHANKVSQGDLSTQIIISNKDEIGTLARNFETMRLSLKNLIGELEEINNKLEQKVEERTAKLNTQTKELERERILLDAVLGSIEQGLLAYDENLNLIVANRRFKEIRDIPDDLLVPGTPFENLIRFDLERQEFGDVDLEKELQEQLARARSFDIHNFERIRPDGTVIEVQGGPIPDGGFVSTFTDITERKKTEVKLNRLAAAIKSTVNGVVITGLDGKIKFVNPAFSKLTGYSKEEALGTSPAVLKSGKHEASFYKGMWDTISSGNVWTGEVINKRKDGSFYDEEMTITPVFSAEGDIVSFVAIKQDITERKIMEAVLQKTSQALANQLSFNEALVDSVPNPIFVKDKDANFTTFNKAFERVFGIKRKDFIGKTTLGLNFLPMADRKKFHAEDLTQLEKGGLSFRELDIPYADGNIHNVLYWTTVFNLADKTTGGLLGVFVDISTQKKLEQDLAKANERMEDELNVGAEIQMSMLPLEFPAFPDRKEFSIFASLYPAREVGGDFYDFFFIDKNKFCFVMADVSGKGVPAALFMAVTKTLIKSRSNNDYSTASIMKHVNDEISADNDSGMFVTVFMGIADLETGKVLYTNAGHNPPYIKRNNGDVEIIDARHGLVVGAMDEVEYKEDELQLQKGDQIFMFTDGVTEAMNTKLELFDEKRLEEVLGGRKFSSSEDITHSVFKAVKKFEDGADQFDDITIMAFKYLGVDKDEIINYFELEVTNDLPELQILTDKLEIFIADNHIDPSFNSHLNLVFDELLNNIISYGYNDSEIHIIIIKVELLKDRLKITISDDGTPFNPFTEKKPDTNLGMDERDIGGLGIHLVRSVMDKMDYKRQIDKNIVILEKQLTTD